MGFGLMGKIRAVSHEELTSRPEGKYLYPSWILKFSLVSEYLSVVAKITGKDSEKKKNQNKDILDLLSMVCGVPKFPPCSFNFHS